MPVFFQQDIDENTRLAVWKIEEQEAFFKRFVPLHRAVTHPHKRLQHLAGRFLLRFLFSDFPLQQIQIADTRKPFLRNEAYHFSVSHCGDYAAVIVSRNQRVGVDIEIPVDKIARIRHKFVSGEEEKAILPQSVEDLTRIWSAKEAVFKWYGEGSVDFRQHIQLRALDRQEKKWNCYFSKTGQELEVYSLFLSPLCLSYVSTRSLTGSVVVV